MLVKFVYTFSKCGLEVLKDPRNISGSLQGKTVFNNSGKTFALFVFFVTVSFALMIHKNR